MVTIINYSRMRQPLTLGAFYLAQGVPHGFLYFTLAGLLAKSGKSASDIGQLLAMASLPWSFKWLFAIVIDLKQGSKFGRRRPWVILAQGGLIVSTAAMLFYSQPTSAIGALTIMVFVQNSFAALQDVSIDAYAVDTIKEEDLGKVNGIMTASNQVGVVFGGAGLNWLWNHAGYQSALVAQIVVLGLVFLFAINFREARSGTSAVDTEPFLSRLVFIIKKIIRLVVASPTRFRLSVVSFVAALLAAVFSILSNILFIQQLGWSKDYFIALNAGWGLAVGMVGSMLGGLISDRFGQSRTALFASFATALVFFVLASGLYQTSGVFVTSGLLLTRIFFTGVLATSLYARLMSSCDRSISAINFSFYMALMNLGGTFGAAASGKIESGLNWLSIFVMVGLGYLLVGVLIPKRLPSISSELPVREKEPLL